MDGFISSKESKRTVPFFFVLRFKAEEMKFVGGVVADDKEPSV